LPILIFFGDYPPIIQGLKSGNKKPFDAVKNEPHLEAQPSLTGPSIGLSAIWRF